MEVLHCIEVNLKSVIACTVALCKGASPLRFVFKTMLVLSECFLSVGLIRSLPLSPLNLSFFKRSSF